MICSFLRSTKSCMHKIIQSTILFTSASLDRSHCNGHFNLAAFQGSSPKIATFQTNAVNLPGPNHQTIIISKFDQTLLISGLNSPYNQSFLFIVLCMISLFSGALNPSEVASINDLSGMESISLLP